MQLEKLISTNREQSQKIADMMRSAAQREALTGQLQAQLAQARLQVQTAQQTASQQTQFDREQLLAAQATQLQAVRPPARVPEGAPPTTRAPTAPRPLTRLLASLAPCACARSKRLSFHSSSSSCRRKCSRGWRRRRSRSRRSR